MNRPAKPAIGIDLGTTFSVLARLDGSGRPCITANSDGDFSTPSAVYFHEGGVIVGKEAAKLARHEPTAVAQFAKREMGKPFYHKAILGQRLPPELIQALVLRRLRRDATLALGELGKVVVTVPACFNEPRRKATMDTGRLAGLKDLDIINAPTAAALAYGVMDGFLESSGRARQREQILVYDLGGGTFDATLIEIDGWKYRTVATEGDIRLGGLDWDERIADYVAEHFKTKFKVDLHENPAAWQALLQEAEDAKRALSSRSKVALHFQNDGHRAAVPLSSALLESMSSDLVDRTICTVKRLLHESGRQWRDITRILLVGGSSRMPMVQRALGRESGVDLDRSLLNEEPVALGAAIHAGLLSESDAGQRPEIEIQDISSHTLGVLGLDRQTKLPLRKLLIAKNTPLPATGSGIFPTLRADQRQVALDVVEGGDDSGRNAARIGRCVVLGLPAGLPVGTRVKVTFTYAVNGRLTVTAKLPVAQSQMTVVVRWATGLSEDEIQEWQQWIDAGAMLQVAKQAGAAEPVLELAADDYLESAYEEAVLADEPSPAAQSRPQRKSAPPRPAPRDTAAAGRDSFFTELGLR